VYGGSAQETPVFWIFSLEMTDYVLLHSSCQEKGRLAKEIQTRLAGKGILTQVSPVDVGEARRVLTSLD
jgi:hypothetical protein